MKRLCLVPRLLPAFLATPLLVRADQTNLAEDDASQGASRTGRTPESGFHEWKMTREGDGADRRSGFFIANTGSNPDLNGIANQGEAWVLYADGVGFGQAVAYRSFKLPLAVGDSSYFLMEGMLPTATPPQSPLA